MYLDGSVKKLDRGTVVDYKATVDRIADCMQLCGMSQAKLAVKMNVSPVVVNQWLHGLSFPNLDSLITMADLFDMYLDDLIVRKQK